ncbi:hypothetical protein LTR17_000566 [Elasticomyces elasticus]|nr:hypothetical protein LTR17_000566 [Elasticomyces elasticus]
MADSTPNKSLEDLHALLSRMCESQVTLTQTVTSLTRTVAELVKSQSETNNNISDLVKAQSANKALDGQAKQLMIETTSNAGTRLTNTYELLEMILLRLPVDTLLLSQRVNKQFQSTIANSKPLQQKLFFAPLPTSAVYREPRVNPMFSRLSLCAALPLYYCTQKRRLRYHDAPSRLGLLPEELELGQWFAKGVPVDFIWSLYVQSKEMGCFTKSASELKGSWRKMLLTRPACEGVIWIRGSKGHHVHVKSEIMSTELTLEQLLEPLTRGDLDAKDDLM